MSEQRVLRLAEEIIAQVEPGRPADGVIRGRLRQGDREIRALGREISSAVFAFYRWRGLLESDEPVREQIREALRRDEAFGAEGRSLERDVLAAVVPAWVTDVMTPTEAWLRSLQTPPRLWLRCRKPETLKEIDSLDHFRAPEPSPGSGAFEYLGQRDLFRTSSFHQGDFEIQDLSSQWVGMLCGVRPGETWWDVCAGEGGKFLDLAERMGNRGQIWVTDRSARRLQVLKRRAARAGVFNYRLKQADVRRGAPFRVQFDGVLLDAPCSGIGTWQRNPDARWTTTLEDVMALAEIQKQLLAGAASRIKSGGRLIYAVCTLARQETDEIVDWFLSNHSDFSAGRFSPTEATDLDSTERCWLGCDGSGGNGMFVARFDRR